MLFSLIFLTFKIISENISNKLYIKSKKPFLTMVSKASSAIGIEQFGGVENLKFLQFQLPPLGPRDILIRIQAIALNPIDAIKRKFPLLAPHNPSIENPHVLGWDGSGIVEEIGFEASFYKKGDEVIFAGDATKHGCYAALMVIDERIVGIKPKTLNWAESAAVPLTSLTVWEALEENMHISLNKENNKDKIILFVGGAGGVGSIGIQLAKIVFGLKVVASASRPETVDWCKKMGADYVINHKNNLKSELDVAGVKGVDYILNCTALTDALIGQFAEIINPLGIICGIIAGPGEKFDMGNMIFAKRVSVTMELMFSRTLLKYDLEKQKKILDNVSKLLDEKKIVTTLTKVESFSLEKVKEGHVEIEKGTNIGKTVLDKVQEYFSKNLQ